VLRFDAGLLCLEGAARHEKGSPLACAGGDAAKGGRGDVYAGS